MKPSCFHFKKPNVGLSRSGGFLGGGQAVTSGHLSQSEQSISPYLPRGARNRFGVKLGFDSGRVATNKVVFVAAGDFTDLLQ